MRRRAFISLLGGAAAMPPSLWPLAGLAQQQGKLPLVGVLVSASPPHPFADALRRGLQNLGYSEGRNITLEVRYSGGLSDRAGEIAAEFVRLGVDVIVAHFTPAVRASLGATQKIPIVMAPAGAPLQSGFIDSLARPGGNVTGLSAMDAEIGGRRLQLLGDLMPSLATFAWPPQEPASSSSRYWSAVPMSSKAPSRLWPRAACRRRSSRDFSTRTGRSLLSSRPSTDWRSCRAAGKPPWQGASFPFPPTF